MPQIESSGDGSSEIDPGSGTADDAEWGDLEDAIRKELITYYDQILTA